METTTIQTWPGGASYTYRGDIHGPAEQRSLRSAYWRGDDADNPWREGTAEEWRAIKVSTLAQIYADRDVLACQSSLIDDLIKAEFEGFQTDDIEGLYPNVAEWDADKCRAWLDDRGIAQPEKPTIECEDCDGSGQVDHPSAEGETVTCDTCSGPGEVPDPDADEDDSRHGYLTELRQAVQDADPEPAEVYEWWLVSSWLCDQLRLIGEVVIDNGQGHWWGRTCTGQGFIMDGTLQEIAARFVAERE